MSSGSDSNGDNSKKIQFVYNLVQICRFPCTFYEGIHLNLRHICGAGLHLTRWALPISGHASSSNSFYALLRLIPHIAEGIGD